MARRRALHPAFDALANLPRRGRPSKTPVPDRQMPPPVSSEDRMIFQAAMANVRPLPPTGRAEIALPKPAPLPRQRARDERQALEESWNGALSLEDHLMIEGEESTFLRPGLPRRTLHDLRRGRWAIQAEIDLHGLDRDSARTALEAFLAECLRRGDRCVRIIHGKGLSSPGGHPVLKMLSRQWLARCTVILAFCHAKPHDGGEGALLALLRTRSWRTLV
jgi:DNA-nicking Smr family endonuclease